VARIFAISIRNFQGAEIYAPCFPMSRTLAGQLFPQEGITHMKFTRAGIVVRFVVLPLFLIVISGTQAQSPQQQHPLLDAFANKVIQKYQTSSCQELKLKKAEKAPPTAQEQKIIQFLKSDPQMRREFINKVAAPIANKMFDCGMIP
jgi:hypothetical protein